MGNKNANSKKPDRRHTPRREDTVYQCIMILNAIAWFTLVVALILFHYARPDLVYGFQQYWGIEEDPSWSKSYLKALQITLEVCVGLSLVSIILRRRRTRRRYDSFGINLFVLSILAVISLITLNTISPAA